MIKNQNNLLKNLNNLARVAIPISFFSISVLVALIVNSVFTSIKKTPALYNASGVPLAWSENIASDNGIVSGSSAKLVNYDEPFIEYSSYVKNTSPSARYLTHLSSYLTAANSENHGFVPLGSTTIEYTYTPADDSSWRSLALSAPANDFDGFKLAEPLYLGPDGNPANTLYFRYGVAADTTISDSLSDKTAFLFSDENHKGETLSVASTSIAYEAPATEGAEASVIATNDGSTDVASDNSASTDTPTEVAVNDPASSVDPTDTEAAATAPLGVVSYAPGTEIIASVSSSDTEDYSPMVTIGRAALIVALAVLASALILYLPICRLR